jgi:hypothetical protein
MSFNERYAKGDKKENTFTPPEGVQSAARKALKWIEDGKAGSGFTSVGRGRAHQLANGESLSLSTVKRMHSFFSRHRVDKQGKDWDKPSAGKVAWYAWGGDAGASWAKSIVEKHDGKKKEASVSFNERYAKKKFWDKDDDPDEGHHSKLSPEQKAKAKARAKSHGRPYPNKVDNVWAAQQKHGSNEPDWRSEYFNLDSDW